MTEDKMVGWHHQLNGHEIQQAPVDGEGEESLKCCSPWGYKESDMTQRLNSNNSITKLYLDQCFHYVNQETFVKSYCSQVLYQEKQMQKKNRLYYFNGLKSRRKYQ